MHTGGIKLDPPEKVDFLLPPKEDRSGEKIVGRHFYIRYDSQLDEYFVKDLGIGYGIFAKIESPIYLQDSVLINLGQTYLVINLEKSGSGNQLSIKVFSSEGANIFTFGEEQTQILIGRSDICDLKVKDKLLSRVQATIYFNPKGKNWTLCDGFKDRPSTNGIYHYVREETEISNGMKLKSNQTIFE